MLSVTFHFNYVLRLKVDIRGWHIVFYSMSDNKALIYNIVSYLNSLRASMDDVDSTRLENVTKDLEDIFQVSSDSVDDFMNFSFPTTNLPQIFESGVNTTGASSFGSVLENAQKNPKYQPFVDMVTSKGYFDGTEPNSIEYLQRQSKLIQKFLEKVANNDNEKVDNEKLAEEKKNLGNAAISAKDFTGAVQFYTEALDLSSSGPSSHIYYCNRAAAYCHLNEYAEAVADCESAIALEPTYVKAFSRLGLSHFFLNNFEEAVQAYEKAVELEPENEGSKRSLKQAKKKLEEKSKSGAVGTSSAAANAGGMPDMSGLLSDPKLANMMNSPFMKNAMDKMGGQAGLASLLNDPNTMAMAQNLMKNPDAMKQMMQMAGNLGGGGDGGMPDLSALAGMMGGAGAGAGKAKSGKKQPFKGFEE